MSLVGVFGWWYRRGDCGWCIELVMNVERHLSHGEADRDSATTGHVLLLNYFFPPMVGGGMPRPVKMAKYLRHLGWKVTVLTVEAEGSVDELLSVDGATNVVRVREWKLGWFLRAADRTVHFMRLCVERLTVRGRSRQTVLGHGFAYEEHEIASSKVGWVLPAVRAALRVHRISPIDVAVVSLPPASSGTVGWLLRRLRGMPYIVEYRDPWTVGAFWTADADGTPRTDVVTRTRLWVTRRLEAALLSDCAGSVIVNGEAHVGRLAAAFARQTAGKPIVHIRNGVDLEDVGLLPRRPVLASTLRLLHTGFFYHFHTPHHLINALRLVQRTHSQALDGVELEFMGGGFPPQLVRELERWGLGDLVRLTEAEPYSQALAAMHRADGLIVVLPPLASDSERLPTKLYEYLSTNRPILAVAHPAGATARLLDGVPGVLVADNGDQEAIASGFATFVAMARQQRVHGYPAESAQRGDAHHYGERAACMDAFLHQVLAPVRASRYGDGSNPG